MIAFRISLNGSHLCTAGLDERGVLSTIVSWVRRQAPGGDEVVECDLDIGGFRSETREHLRWAHRDLRRGDQIQIEILDLPKVDEPEQREAEDPNLVESAERQYYEQLRRKFGDA